LSYRNNDFKLERQQLFTLADGQVVADDDDAARDLLLGGTNDLDRLCRDNVGRAPVDELLRAFLFNLKNK